jgi:mono/diheme cytochrome c family protein
MLKKILKITGIVLGSILLIGILFYIKMYFSTEKRIHKVYAIQPEKIDIPTDSASLALGNRLATTKGCRGCHGEDLGGKVFINDPMALGFLIAKNITKGKGGLPQDYNEEDWIMALKHGLNRHKKSILVMPSYEFAQLTESDMAALIAYCAQATPVDRELPASKVGPLGRVLADLGELPLLPAEMINHETPLASAITPSLTVEYGKYLAVSCQGCHRENMKGGDPIAPGFPPVADITSTGNPGRWTDEQFMTTLRTGKTPDGKILDPEYMPWESALAMTDLELKALHLYLKSL